MRQIYLLIGAIMALAVAYVGFTLFRNELIAEFIRPAILPLLIVYYLKSNFKRSTYFLYFLILYALGDLLGLVDTIVQFPQESYIIIYFGCNLLYVASYISLILYMVKSMDLTNLSSRFAPHIIILLILDVYCVILVTDVAIQSNILEGIYEYMLEFVYNIAIMVLLTVALINYLHRDSPKSMNLLLGALCVVFSEVIQVAYYYVSETFILGVSYVILMVIAFLLFVIQAKMTYPVKKEHLETEITEISA